MAPIHGSAALQRRHDPRAVHAALEAFLATGDVPEAVDPVVAASWRRSVRSGVDPDGEHDDTSLARADLEEYRRGHRLAVAMPMIRELLVEGAVGDGLVVAVTDAAGRLLWVEGRGRVRSAVERVGFVEGALWGEDHVGTNAPGTALATRRAVQVVGAEHFSRPVQHLSCAAAPVRDPGTGDVIGVLDVTGGRAAGTHVALSLVRAVAAGVERELARDLRRPGVAHALVDLEVLGTPRLAELPGRPLTTRHAEILLLLSEHPQGLTADELAVLLHPGDLSGVTVRAEVSRLRRAVGPLLLAPSRPYRLSRPLRTDLAEVHESLARGDVDRALALYVAPVLPRSVAPAVERLRAELSAEVRAAVLAGADAGVLERWVRHVDGADDHAAWARLAAVAPAGSPRSVRARARLALLEAELG